MMLTDWKEEAFRAFAARYAEEETEWQKRNPGKVKFYLVNAPDEPPTISAEGQASLREVIDALRENKIDADAPIMAVDAVDAVGGYTGEIAVLAQAFGPTLGVILVAWIQGRSGRKLRLKVGDVEIEGRTPAEIDQMRQMVSELRHQEAVPKDAGTP